MIKMTSLRKSIEHIYILIDCLKNSQLNIKSEKSKKILDHFIIFLDYSTMDIVLNKLNKKKLEKINYGTPEH